MIDKYAMTFDRSMKLKMSGLAKLGSPAFAMQPGETAYVQPDKFSDFLGLPKRHQGGPIKQSGGYELLAGEMVIDQHAATIIRAAVSSLGSTLNQQAMDKVVGGTESAGAPTVIQDNSTNQVTNNNTTVTPPQTRGQILPGQGRDHGVSHFTHAA